MAVKAGGEVDSWCTKCKMDLSHRVVAMVGGTPKRVECQTCHSQHNYRPPKNLVTNGKAGAARAGAGSKKSASKSAGSKAAPKPTKQQHQWETLIAGKSGGAFRAYSIYSKFEPDELIRHKTFGDGCVLEVLQDQKITVLFREGSKVLIHSRVQ